jgi:hypothetical protein
MESVPFPISWVVTFAKSNPWPIWFFLCYVALFGIRVGTKETTWFQVHGVVNSLWQLAQNVGLAVDRLGRIEDKLNKALGIEASAVVPVPPK